MSEWTELKTLQDVAAAQARGDEIQFERVHNDDADGWYAWYGSSWNNGTRYRSRPKKRMKTIVLREALFHDMNAKVSRWVTEDCENWASFICWLEAPVREIEVEE